MKEAVGLVDHHIHSLSGSRSALSTVSPVAVNPTDENSSCSPTAMDALRESSLKLNPEWRYRVLQLTENLLSEVVADTGIHHSWQPDPYSLGSAGGDIPFIKNVFYHQVKS